MELISVPLMSMQEDSGCKCIFVPVAHVPTCPLVCLRTLLPRSTVLKVSGSPEHPSHGCFRSKCTRHYSCIIPNGSRDFVSHGLTKDSFMHSVSCSAARLSWDYLDGSFCLKPDREVKLCVTMRPRLCCWASEVPSSFLTRPSFLSYPVIRSCLALMGYVTLESESKPGFSVFTELCSVLGICFGN